MEKEEKQYQVWVDYGSEGWHLDEFNTFTECVDFIKEGRSCRTKITKRVEDESYVSFLKRGK